jgi:hypothetical protein
MAQQSRFRTGIALAKISWHTLRQNKALMAFPVAGMIAALIDAIVLTLPGILLLALTSLTWLAIVLFAISAYVAVFIGTFVGVGLCVAADKTLRGEATSFSDGIHAARERIPQIAKWALLATTVALVIRVIEARFEGIGGTIVAALAGLAWALVSFLAIPVIAFEGVGPINALKRSSSLFKQRWGQQVTGQAITGGVVGIFIILPGILLAVIGGVMIGNSVVAAGAVVLAIGIIIIIIGSVISGTLSQILSVALYHYAVDGQGVGPYSTEMLAGVVRPKGRAARA